MNSVSVKLSHASWSERQRYREIQGTLSLERQSEKEPLKDENALIYGPEVDYCSMTRSVELIWTAI